MGMAALVGCLWALPFLFTAFAGIAWFIPMILLLIAGSSSRFNHFQMGYVIGLYFNLIALYWLLFIPVRVGAISGWLVLSAYCALYPAAWVYFCWRMLPSPKKPFQNPALFSELLNRLNAMTWLQRQLWALVGAISWTSAEMLQAHLLTGFPWNLLAISQVEMLPLIQLASFTGVYGVSFLVAWVSLTLGLAIASIAAQPGQPWIWWGRDILPAGVILLVVWALGFQRIQNAPPTSQRLRVALIQPSVSQMIIWEGSQKEERFKELLRLSEAALALQPDLLIWPESGLPSGLEAPERVAQFVRENQLPLIFNEVDHSVRPDATEPLYYNAAFLMNQDGEIVDRAHKHQLVMFGEYTPLAKTFPILGSLSPVGTGFARGEKPGILKIDELSVTVGILICFEDAFPSLAREAAQRNPDFLVNLTNDAWFGDSKAQWQHARGAAFRAIENNLPLVRCTNNGITCWIDSYGRIQVGDIDSPDDVYKKGFKVIGVPIQHPAASNETRYRQDGDLFGWSCVSISLALLLVRELFRLRGSSYV
ncbi:MAG: Apolipoprotein N-acyltransferase [Verrucomicrobia subdivision 3 bacterium]|nr:Apolipoprotein N-acyltransferase [Limisphaerales bacterium]MCS1416641.1 Apolipoprotein N-acyltransferase [Limisphaerales bacterium]